MSYSLNSPEEPGSSAQALSPFVREENSFSGFPKDYIEDDPKYIINVNILPDSENSCDSPVLHSATQCHQPPSSSSQTSSPPPSLPAPLQTQ